MAEDLELKLKKLEQDINNREYKNLYLFFGQEKNLKTVYKNMLIEEALGEAEKDMNLEIVTKETYDKNSISDKINSIPFFADKRIVVLDEVGIKDKGELNELFLNIPEDTIVIVMEEDLKNNDDDTGSSKDTSKEKFNLKKLKDSEELKNKYIEINFDKATDNIISAKVLSICEEYGVKMSKMNLDYLVKRVGTDLSLLECETHKLCNYKIVEKEINKEDIDTLVTENLEETVFNLIENITRKNMTQVQKIYNNLLTSGNDEKTIMPLIAWQYMLVLEVKMALEENKTQVEIMNLTKQKEYPVKKAIQVAQKINLKTLKEIVKMCNETAIDFYKGNINLDLLIDKIIAS